MRELFIYYRVRTERAAEALSEVAAMQSALRAALPTLGARLLRRSDPAGSTETWMETYALPAATGVDAQVQSLIERHAWRLAGCIEGPRHVEVFTEVEARPAVPD